LFEFWLLRPEGYYIYNLIFLYLTQTEYVLEKKLKFIGQ